MEMLKTYIEETLAAKFRWLPARIALGGLTLLGFVNLYMVRVNISLAIVAMVNVNDTAHSVSEAQCLAETSLDQLAPEDESITDGNLTTVMSEDYQPTGGEQQNNGTSRNISDDNGKAFQWDGLTQGLILSSFSYGYAVTQVTGGRLAELKGTKWVFGICILAGGITSLLTPLMAHAHYTALIGIRIVLGLFQGVSWPSIHALITRWIPPLERPRFVAIVYFAATFSITFTYPLCGVVIANHGWEAVFYVCGGCSLIWCIFWFTCMYDDPSLHPRMSVEERDYIEQSIRPAGKSRDPPKCIPWKQIATSLPVWAIIVCDMGNTFGLSVYMSQLPTYMRNVLGFTIKENGFLSGLPYFCRYVGAVSSGFLSDWILTRGYLSTIVTRKIFCSIAMMGPACLLIGVIYSGCSATTIVVLLCLAHLANGSIAASQIVNHTDIAPNFAGTLFGISNTFAAVSSSIAPVAVGAIIKDKQTMEQWEKVFWMGIPIFVTTGLFFLIFGSGSVQPWNFTGQKEGGDDGSLKSEASEELQPLSEEGQQKQKERA